MAVSQPDPKTIVWFRNEFLPLGDANVNVLTHGLNYGSGVFEGIRGYWVETDRELYLFRVKEHYERWRRNCGILRIELPRTPEQFCELTAELCRRNRFHANVYARPLAFKAAEGIGVAADDNDACAVVVIPMGDYFSGHDGLRAGVSSWRRVDDTAIPGRGKITGIYANSVLAGDEARRAGHDEAIFLNSAGHVAEGAACNLFLVRDGRVITPPVSDDILEGITRDAVLRLLREELNLDPVERSIDRSELYVCDEIFFTGTAVEVTPVVAVDFRRVGTGKPGPVTERVRAAFAEVVRGRTAGYRHWLWPVYASVAEPVAAMPASHR